MVSFLDLFFNPWWQFHLHFIIPHTWGCFLVMGVLKLSQEWDLVGLWHNMFFPLPDFIFILHFLSIPCVIGSKTCLILFLSQFLFNSFASLEEFFAFVFWFKRDSEQIALLTIASQSIFFPALVILYWCHSSPKIG